MGEGRGCGRLSEPNQPPPEGRVVPRKENGFPLPQRKKYNWFEIWEVTEKLGVKCHQKIFHVNFKQHEKARRGSGEPTECQRRPMHFEKTKRGHNPRQSLLQIRFKVRRATAQLLGGTSSQARQCGIIKTVEGIWSRWLPSALWNRIEYAFWVVRVSTKKIR